MNSVNFVTSTELSKDADYPDSGQRWENYKDSPCNGTAWEGRQTQVSLSKEERPHKPPVHCQVKRQIQPKSKDQVQKH